MSDLLTWKRRIARRSSEGGRGRDLEIWLCATHEGWKALGDTVIALMQQGPDMLALRITPHSDSKPVIGYFVREDVAICKECHDQRPQEIEHTLYKGETSADPVICYACGTSLEPQ